MKLNGEKVEGPNVEILVIPRGGNRPDVVFQARAILDSKPFETLCPAPVPPVRIMKGGAREKNFDDPGYKTEMELYNEKRMAWMVIESLKATDGLEWETVKENDHTTWTGFKDELKAAGFSYIEVQRIENCVYAANCLNETKVEEARKSFLRGLATV